MSTKTAEDVAGWEVLEFPWGSAVRKVGGDYERVFFAGGQEVDVTGIDVMLHENGIEFINNEKPKN